MQGTEGAGTVQTFLQHGRAWLCRHRYLEVEVMGRVVV